MNFLNVLKKIDALESNEPKQTITESKKSTAPIQLDEGLDTNSLKMLAGTQSISECGMPTMGAMMPPTMPASLNMSAGNASEIVSMVRGLMDLAKTDGPSQAPMGALGAPMPDLMGMGGVHEPMTAEPEHDDIGGAKIPDVKGMDDPIAGAIGASDEIGGATDLGSAGDDEIMNLIKKIRTGEPVKVTTDHPVKVSTDQEVKHKGPEADDEQEDEDARPYDNSPKEKVKAYNPNDMADLRDKVSAGDKEYEPPASADNPLKKTSDKDEEKKDESLAAFEAQLFNEYKKFVNEGKKEKKADKDYDGDGEIESPKDEVWGSRAKAAAKAGKPFKEAEEKETMSQAGKGVMKYGKDGMKALAKAGKEGKDLEKIKDKYNKYKD